MLKKQRQKWGPLVLSECERPSQATDVLKLRKNLEEGIRFRCLQHRIGRVGKYFWYNSTSESRQKELFWAVFRSMSDRIANNYVYSCYFWSILAPNQDPTLIPKKTRIRMDTVYCLPYVPERSETRLYPAKVSGISGKTGVNVCEPLPRLCPDLAQTR